MDDILERLRAGTFMATMRQEAANEIEALRAKAQGYYNEAADGWTNFRRAERVLDVVRNSLAADNELVKKALAVYDEVAVSAGSSDAEIELKSAYAMRDRHADRALKAEKENERLRDLLADAQKQLPREMLGCTIVYKQCHLGHSRLVGSNWVDHGCLTCAASAAETELEAIETKAENMRLIAEVRSLCAQIQFSDAYGRPPRPMTPRESLKAKMLDAGIDPETVESVLISEDDIRGY